MTKRFARDRIINALRALPPDASINDAIKVLVSLSKIERGISELHTSSSIRRDSVRRRFDQLVADGVIRPPLEDGDPLEAWPDIRLPCGSAKQLIDADRDDR